MSEKITPDEIESVVPETKEIVPEEKILDLYNLNEEQKEKLPHDANSRENND